MMVGTSTEREVCGSDIGPGGSALSVGGWGKLDQNLLWPLLQSGSVGGWKREWRSSDWLTSLLVHYHYFPSPSLYAGTRGETCTRKYIRFAPMRTPTHIHELTQGRGNVVTTALNPQVRGYHYKWLTLTFSRSKVSLITLGPLCHTHTHTRSDPEPLSLSCKRHRIIHLTGRYFICGYEVGPIFSPHKRFLSNLSRPVCVCERNGLMIDRSSVKVKKKKKEIVPPL